MKNINNKKLPLKILFLERSPFMSVEILDLLNNYSIICYSRDFIYELLKKDWHIYSYFKNNFFQRLENDKAIEIILNNTNFLKNMILDKKNTGVLLFFMNLKIDKLLKNNKILTLLPDYNIQEKLGNKLHLSHICKKLKISLNRSMGFENKPKKLGEVYKKCRRLLGAPFILQGPLGVSGEDTFLVNTKNDLHKATKDLYNGFRATRYISNNIPVSVHICILKNQIIIRGPFLQLLGFPQLSSNPFQFAGNDTNQTLFNKSFINEVRLLSYKIGEYLKKEGYKGILGIDYLWDKDKNTIFPQELNTRFVGLTRLLTGIQKDQLIFPDLLKHIETFSMPSYSKKCTRLNRKNITFSKYNYSQIIIYNNLAYNITILHYIKPSIYKIRNGILHLTKSSLFMHDMKDDDVLITQTAQPGAELHTGDIIAKIILKKSSISNRKYELSLRTIKIVNLIRKTMIND